MAPAVNDASTAVVNTVLGPVAADAVGVIAAHEALLSVYPGAQYGYDVTIDRAAVFETLAKRLTDFANAGGGTVVDATGMFHGRDLPLYEALSRSTGVHIVASTGQGPESLLGGYFLTPQTNPPSPWPAEKFADLFAKEITDGMVVPRLERRGRAGLIAVVADRAGMTATEQSLFRGAARAAVATGAAVSARYGADALRDVGVLLDEGLPAGRIAVSGLDRPGADPMGVAARGVYVGIDHVGTETEVTDDDRAALVAELVAAGHGDRVLVSSSATGVAVGHPAVDVPLDHVLTTFVPLLKARGLTETDISRILVDNPRDLLSIEGAQP